MLIGPICRTHLLRTSFLQQPVQAVLEKTLAELALEPGEDECLGPLRPGWGLGPEAIANFERLNACARAQSVDLKSPKPRPQPVLRASKARMNQDHRPNALQLLRRPSCFVPCSCQWSIQSVHYLDCCLEKSCAMGLAIEGRESDITSHHHMRWRPSNRVYWWQFCSLGGLPHRAPQGQLATSVVWAKIWPATSREASIVFHTWHKPDPQNLGKPQPHKRLQMGQPMSQVVFDAETIHLCSDSSCHNFKAC